MFWTGFGDVLCRPVPRYFSSFMFMASQLQKRVSFVVKSRRVNAESKQPEPRILAKTSWMSWTGKLHPHYIRVDGFTKISTQRKTTELGLKEMQTALFL